MRIASARSLPEGAVITSNRASVTSSAADQLAVLAK